MDWKVAATIGVSPREASTKRRVKRNSPQPISKIDWPGVKWTRWRKL